MKKVKLPLTINPKKDAMHRVDYKGFFEKSSLVRLNDIVGKVQSDAQVALSLDTDSQGLTVIKGTAQVEVELECQRCGNLFSQKLDCNFNFSPVSNMNQADELPEIYEPVELDEFGEINLLDTIIDEFILNLPLVPKHNDEHCEVSVADMIFGDIPDEEEEKPNPFAVLANLKK